MRNYPKKEQSQIFRRRFRDQFVVVSVESLEVLLRIVAYSVSGSVENFSSDNWPFRISVDYRLQPGNFLYDLESPQVKHLVRD